jgi:hypothetical protein
MLKCLQIVDFGRNRAFSRLSDAWGALKPVRIPAPVRGLGATPYPGGRLTSRSTWALIGALIVLVGALALCLDRFRNGDFYLSLTSGRFIAQHGFASHDPFSTISQGGTWLNQQWLSELAFFRISEVFGPTGLTVLYAVLITAPLALLLWLCRRKGWWMLVAVTAFYFPGVLRAWTPDLLGALRRIHAGAVITHVNTAIRQLEAARFRPEFSSADGTYLVRVPHQARLSGA